ncbi:MAG: glycosyltransferase family 2 protein [Marinilabiliaceae bacterium]|nr:glycosyltransferase family 2 protein [Marinilabiliaceae bacterium]
MEKIPVTIVIPVKNEERNLPECLSRLDDFDEIVVVDSHSTDATKTIAEERGCRYVDFSWNGQFPKKRNWTLRNVPLRNEWVFFLDADEFVTPKFVSELRRVLTRGTECVGFWVNYTNDFMGKELKHGAAMPKLPLFRKSAGEYEFIDEKRWSHLDMEIHEHPILNGKIGEIKSPIVHREFKGLNHYIQKHNEYSDWEARRFIEKKESGSATGELSFRQKVKYSLLDCWMCAPLYFLYSYFYKLGFLDGTMGFIYAAYKMQYFFNVKAKIYEFKKEAKGK